MWYVAIAIYLFDAIFFVIFGSGEEQYWNTIYVDDSVKTDTLEQADKISSSVQRTDSISSCVDDRNTYDISQPQKIPRAKLD